MEDAVVHNCIAKVYAHYMGLNECISDLKGEDLRRVRRINFPECVSEYVAYRVLSKRAEVKRDVKSGDLEERINGVYEKIEIKCVSSRGPISFGPTEPWKRLYILVVQPDERFCLYRANYANTSREWKRLKVSKKQTFEDQAKQGRRPRIKFELLKEQIQLEPVVRGSIRSVLKMI